MQKTWGDKKYHSLNYFLREKFGDKVFKVALDAGFSCPNRDGTISSGGCLFCSERGSGDFGGDRKFSITSQFEDIVNMMSKKWKTGRYIAYFQAYTNTYGSIEVLREKYEEAISQEGVVALAIATRPDCLDEDVLDLIEEYSHRVYTWVELGLQTSKDESAKIINRGYKLSKFEEALKGLNKRNIDVVVHTIFGLPGETEEDMLKTIDYVAHSDIKGIKMHLLYLVENTPMVELYNLGKLKFLEKDEYIDIIARSIAMLPPNMVIHRLTGDAPRDLLIGPMWSLKKWEVLNSIDNKLKELDLYQGKNLEI
ncbi:TIGR01212 family radical SAM protein [Clostridium sp. FP2]|uniref:TIGR01212 family radical SAM protein n=1 Tax=Clostridium TaxID=1485 RepID=UPI0013E8F9B8|nr:MULTISPECIES: TIGR01212 family radical SAM protein [Clostridium]MBW9156219.1 TIGR01212 family radical SAM protein [Clostridium tagluense]MBZ9625791.1 TIGR01212 family radical SAM protein [Clostridium sp. FP2]WLC65544.1 TIGR01212 family radical SAM protein [Clostridium tagluense]